MASGALDKKMKNFLKLVLLIGILPLAISCVAPSHHGELSFGDEPVPQGTYDQALSRWTQNDKAYSGLSESYQVSSTLLSKEIVEQQVYMDAEEYHWTAEQFKDARQKALYDLTAKTTFFMAVYTEKDESNNLDKTNTIWNVFLNVNGHHYPTTSVKRIYDNREVLLRKYPYIQVWSRYYWVTFGVSTNEVTAGSSELTIAGPLGGSHLHFPN